MAISKVFAGSTFYKPGAYSRTVVQTSVGSNLTNNSNLFLIGEASEGLAGSEEGIQFFAATRLSDLVAKYVSGPIVDCALVASTPAPATAGIGGFGGVYVYKTNSPATGSRTLKDAQDAVTQVTVTSVERGASANDISVTIAAGSGAKQKTVTISKVGETPETLGENDGTAILSITYTGDGTASYAITGASWGALKLAATYTGDPPEGEAAWEITLADKTMTQLVAAVEAKAGFTSTLLHSGSASVAANELDPVAVAGLTKDQAVSLYRAQHELIDLINDESELVTAALAATPVPGLPVNISAAGLSGGSDGFSTDANFSAALLASQDLSYKVVVPCISRDASEDIADGLTNPSSTYTIAGVAAAVSSHLVSRESVKTKREAFGVIGVRKAAKADAFAFATTLNDKNLQVCIQDVKVTEVSGSLAWKHPHVLAAIAAGFECGMVPGTAKTYKYLIASGIGHIVNPATGASTGDFNATIDYDAAIAAGVLYAAPGPSAGFRWDLDCTTYGEDANFMYNRANVRDVATFLTQNLRIELETRYVGKNITNTFANDVKATTEAFLTGMNSQGYIVASDDGAPFGFKGLVVTQEGSVTTISVEIKPVLCSEFIFLNLNVSELVQGA